MPNDPVALLGLQYSLYAMVGEHQTWDIQKKTHETTKNQDGQHYLNSDSSVVLLNLDLHDTFGLSQIKGPTQITPMVGLVFRPRCWRKVHK